MLEKDLNYYKKLDYSIIVTKESEDDETWFVAYCNELGKYSCFGKGLTTGEAIENFYEVKEGFIEMLYSKGLQIPEPEKEIKYSGYFNVRTSPKIHCLLVEQAKRDNVSLNAYLNQILACATGVRNTECSITPLIKDICTQLENHHFEVTRYFSFYLGNIEMKIEKNIEKKFDKELGKNYYKLTG